MPALWDDGRAEPQNGCGRFERLGRPDLFAARLSQGTAGWNAEGVASLLHDLRRTGRTLADKFHLIAPDYIGFGA